MADADDYEVARDAVVQLGQSGHPIAARHLVGLLEASSQINLAADAQEALICMGSVAVPELIAALESGPDLHTQLSAAYCLGRIGDRHVLDRLGNAFAEAGGPLRVELAIALGMLGDDRSSEELVKLIDADDLELRERAAEALARTRAAP